MSRIFRLIISGLEYIKAKILMFIFGFFSIDNSKILVSNFNGKGYGENPAAVCDELLKRDNNFKIYWIVENQNDESIPKQIIKVKKYSIKYYYHLRTSKIWLFNKRNNLEINKRKKQFYIQLWHGPIGLKKIEKDCEEHLNKFYVKAAKKDSKYIDLMISNSKHFTNICEKSFWYSGRVEKYGTPKNDILINTKDHNKIINKVKKQFNINNEKILLYAPTFRDNYQTDAYDIDLEKIQKELERKYKCKYKVFVRMHPNVSKLNLSKLLKNNNIINVSDYPELNDLLIASDILISDYSSIMFDYALMKKKVFLYISDLDKIERGFYFDLKELPFSLAKNTNELLNNINNYNEEKYLKELNNFYKKIELFEDGKASERVVDEIEKAVKEENSLTSKTMSGILWKFLERFCAQGVSFIVSIVLARLLLPEDFGNVAMILIFITIADVFVNSGFATALIQKKDADDLDYSTMFYSSQFTSILIYIAIFFLAPLVGKFYNNDLLVLLLRVFALRIPLSVFNSIQHAYVSNKMLFKRFFFSTLIGTIISGIVGILLAYQGYGVWSLISQYFINTIVDTVVLFITTPWRPKLLYSKVRAKKLMSFGSKVLLADLSGTFFDQLRVLLIGKKYTSADLAFYEKGSQFSGFISSNIISSIMTVLFPALSKISDNIEKVKNASRSAVQVLSLAMYPLLFGLIICAKPIIIVLLTDKWIDSVDFVRLLSISSLIGLVSNVSLQTIKAIGRSDVLLKLEFIKKPIFLLLLIIGISINVRWVAITMVIYSFIGSLINMIALSKYIHYSLIEQIKDILVPLIGSVLMMLAIYVIKVPFSNMLYVLLIQILLGMLIYIGFILIIKPKGYLYFKKIIKRVN